MNRFEATSFYSQYGNSKNRNGVSILNRLGGLIRDSFSSKVAVKS